MIDIIAKVLDLTPLSEKILSEVNSSDLTHVCTNKDTSPFNQIWFSEIRSENGKRSKLINEWNGSEEQKQFLKIKYKNRNITWGSKITESKSHGMYKILIDGKVYYTLSINKFAKEHGLNTASLRNSLWNKKQVDSKGHKIKVSLEK